MFFLLIYSTTSTNTGKDDSPAVPPSLAMNKETPQARIRQVSKIIEYPLNLTNSWVVKELKHGQGRPRGSQNKKTIEAHTMQNHRPSDASGNSGVTDGSSGIAMARPAICCGPGRPRLEPRGIQVSVDVMICKFVLNTSVLY